MNEKQTNDAQAVIDRMTQAHAEMHDHALAELARIEETIARVKAALAEHRNRSQQETQIYIETVDRALQAAAALDDAVDSIAATTGARAG